MARTDDRLHDARRVYHFWIDDAVIDIYGPRIGLYGIAIYTYLARRAKAGRSFPSHGRIAKDLRTSRRTVIRTMKTLEAARLVTIESRMSSVGDPDTNIYIIQDLSHLHGSDSQTLGSDSQTLGSDSQTLGVVSNSGEGSVCVAHEVFPLKGSHLEEDLKPSISSEDRRDAPPKVENVSTQIKEKKAKAITSRRCPPGHMFDASIRTWAAEKYPSVDVDEAIEAMRDWEYKTPRSDWDACLRTWIRIEAKRPVRPKTSAEIAAERKKQLEQLVREEQEKINGHGTD